MDDECASNSNDSNARVVFRVEATGREDKENAMCACDAVE